MTISLLRLWSHRFLDSGYLRMTSNILSLPTASSTHEYTVRYGGVKMVAYPEVWTAVYSCIEGSAPRQAWGLGG